MAEPDRLVNALSDVTPQDCLLGRCPCSRLDDCKFRRCPDCGNIMDASNITLDPDAAGAWINCQICGGPIL